MRLPRDVSGRHLAKRLEKFDYVVVRQRGSHIRLERQTGDPHRITIPDHSALRLGTLRTILSVVGNAAGKDTDTVAREIFGD